jgi:hypothetical protein
VRETAKCGLAEIVAADSATDKEVAWHLVIYGTILHMAPAIACAHWYVWVNAGGAKLALTNKVGI